MKRSAAYEVSYMGVRCITAQEPLNITPRQWVH